MWWDKHYRPNFCMGVMFVVLVVFMVAVVYSVHSKLGFFWVCLS